MTRDFEAGAWKRDVRTYRAHWKTYPEWREEACKGKISYVDLPKILIEHHLLTQTVVELNLRLPSMLHGKKGFERIVWAFRNVLTESVAWLFCDLTPESNGLANGWLFQLKENSVQF